MLATFVLMEPVPVVIAFVAMVAAATYARLTRGTTRVMVAAAVGLAALGLGTILVTAETSSAHLLLLVFGVVAAFVLSVELYRRRRTKLTFESAALCILGRTMAWLVVLLLIAQPRWDWVIVEWEEPLLTVLLDQSKSMSITDRQSPAGRSRQAIVNQTITDARTRIDRLDNLYEVQALAIGESYESIDDWQVRAQAPVSAIAAAIRHAGQSRSVHGEPPVVVLLISDGAENAVNPRVVREAAAELAAQRTALLTVGVGPAAELTPAVVLDPLVVPGRIGSRDRMRVPIVAQVTGCAGHTVGVALMWDGRQADERRVQIERAAQRARTEFELQPPGIGLHRLTARITLPADLGGDVFETSVVVDVSDDRIRVLMLAEQPRNESAFASRAVAADPRFEVTQRLLFGGAAQPTPTAPAHAVPWSDYDVVILGNVPGKRLGFDTLADLADAVRERGVGLLMAGGRDFYHDGYYSRSELRDVCPVDFAPAPSESRYRPRFRPTEAGLRHPVMLDVFGGRATGGNHGGTAETWDTLPPLSAPAQFGKAKPLATILAADSRGGALLAALDVGRGRTLAAAWDNTWPWALSSEEGLAAHGKLWRQMVAWLANRRPVAWVVTERSSYVRAALAGGQQAVSIRAGLSGAQTPADRARRAEYKARLQLRLTRTSDASASAREQKPSTAPASLPTVAPVGKTWEVPLERRGNEWHAELPQDLQTQAWLAGGAYELTFVVEQTAAGRSSATAVPGDLGDGEPLLLIARTGFAVRTVDLELLEPTANLALLRESAARTAAIGGAYFPIAELPVALRQLAENDRRRRIEHHAAYDLIVEQPWLLLVLVAAAMAMEWVVRKRGGLA